MAKFLVYECCGYQPREDMGESLVQWGDPEGLLTASVGLLQPGLGLHANHTGPRS